jgi:RNA polymerase sigma-70 factor, ECF subfamily
MEPIAVDFESIYLQFRGKIKGFVLRYIQDEQTAEDIVHDVFIKIHNKIDTLRDERKLESWIYQITRRTITDHHRQRKNLQLDAVNIPDNNPENDDRPLRQIAEGLLPMIESLPDHYREALVLTEFNGLTQKEFAEKVGISISGAKSRVQRARGQLKEKLFQCCHFEFNRSGKIIDYYPRECPCCPNSR